MKSVGGWTRAVGIVGLVCALRFSTSVALAQQVSEIPSLPNSTNYPPVPSAQRNTDEVSRFATHNWQSQDGLPHNSVQALAQTRDGYLWLGTEQGLARFDGVQFTVVDATNELGKDVSITALAVTKDGTLWIGTREHGLFQYQQGRFSPFNAGNTNQLIRALHVSSDDSLWVSSGDGLLHLESGQLQPVAEQTDVRAMSDDSEGGLLLGTGSGLRKIKDRQLIRSPFPSLGIASVRAIALGREGEVWVGTGNGLIHVSEEKTGRIGRADGLAADMINAVFEDRSGRTWVGTSSGLNYITADGAIHEIKHEGGSLDSVYAILEDREENLWIGARDGLYRLNPKLFTTYTKEHGLANHNVTSVREDRGRLWIGTWGGGLHSLENGVISRYPITNEYFNGLVLGLFLDRTGSLWIGTDFEGGMYRRDKDDRVYRYWKDQGASNLESPVVRTIIHDTQKGRIWVGTKDALNVAIRGKYFWRYTTENGLPDDNIHVIKEDTLSCVWVGTDGGLVQFNKDDQITVFTTKDGLSNNRVTALYEDADNTLWIGTEGGLNRRKNGKFTSYTTRHGLFSDEIFEIVEDNFNRLWMTCRSGIFWIAKSDIEAVDTGKSTTISCVSYGKDDGLNSVNCNNVAKPSAWKTQDGRLWFATVKGLSVIDPASISRAVKAPPPVVVEKILWNRKSFTPGAELELPAGRGELEFQFTALSLQSPERNRFKYKLEPVDTEWNEAGTRRFAHYNNIYHGKYVFRVLACDGAGVWNLTGASVSFRLLPQFWQTWWFRGILLMIPFIALAGLYRVRVSRIREMERLRVRIAADLHDEIGSSIGSISLLTQKIQKEGPLLDDQKSDLSSIGRISTQAANAIREIVWFINPQYDTMQDLLSRMRDAAGTMLAGMRVRLTFPQEDMTRKVSPEFRRNTFLMYKEMLGNIIKHAKASEVEIVVVDKKRVWLLIVRDNGVGFNADGAYSGHGLKNLRQRAERLHGSLEIRGQPGSGTTIIFSTSRL